MEPNPGSANSANSDSAAAHPLPSTSTTASDPDSPFPLTAAGNGPYDYRYSTLSDDRAAALDVEKRIKQRERDDRAKRAGADQKPLSEEERQESAATVVQCSYRCARAGQRETGGADGVDRLHVSSRTARGLNLSSSERWSDGIQKQKLKRAGSDQDAGKNDTSASPLVLVPRSRD